MNPNNMHKWLIVGALALASYACYNIIAPYLGPICLAFIISLLFYPIHEKIQHKITAKPNLSALISCALITTIILLPLTFVLSAVLQQAVGFSTNAYSWVTTGGAQELLNNHYIKEALDLFNTYTPMIHISQEDILAKLAGFASTIGAKSLGISGRLLGDVGQFFANFSLMLFVLFFLLRDQHTIVETMRHVIPLSRSQEDIILEKIESVAKSAVLGSFLTALAQGLLGGIGMWIVGYAGLFWGTMLGFASFIPMIGTALIWIPAAIYLFITGDLQWGVFFVLWNIMIVGSVDNFLRPMLMSGSSSMSTLVIFFALIGGIQVYGLLGLIYGPIIFALTIVLFNIYEAEFFEFLTKQNNK